LPNGFFVGLNLQLKVTNGAGKATNGTIRKPMSVHMPRDSTVLQLKENLFERKEVVAESVAVLKITWKGKTLADDKTLISYGLKSRDNVQVIRQLGASSELPLTRTPVRMVFSLSQSLSQPRVHTSSVTRILAEKKWMSDTGVLVLG
jgi:hypothetical protein